MKALRVLLVEDDAMIGMLIAEILKDMGHEVCAIEVTRRAAVVSAARYRPDLMIVDARLGDGSGVLAVEEILRSGHLPHMFITGNALGVRAVRPDAVVLEKPFRESDLVHAIECVFQVATAPALAEPS